MCNSEDESIQVSVCMITYNHEKFIQQAIEGVLIQQCVFRIELIIADDFSPDGTEKIVTGIINNNPNSHKIKYTRHEQNKGMIQNFFWALNQCRGKMIAFCEGDDYWIDPKKLQKQVDFLNENEEYSMVCTNYNKYYEIGKHLKYNCFPIDRYPEEVTFHDYLLDRTAIATSTVLLRQNIWKLYKERVLNNNEKIFNVGDTPFWLFTSIISKIKVIPDTTSVYRINQNSASKFELPQERYEFRKKGYEIPFFFMSYKATPKIIRGKIKISYLLNEMLGARVKGDKWQEFRILLKVITHSKYSIKKSIKAMFLFLNIVKYK